MLVLLMDMIVIWFLLNFFSDENWDDRKGMLFVITLVIALCGGAILTFLGPYLGFFSLGVYVLAGGVLLKFLADLDWQRAFQAMSAFLVYKVILIVLLLLVFAGLSTGSWDEEEVRFDRPASQQTARIC
ncbi:hypothetical protein SH661x_004532 [Planctomicrobium sp. SH661]|uniref:hypothetical protein n=1 Tax=Planctomicrobium sp. SH661 TaxID=3448124 RepID=UPI003F5CBB5B